MTGTPLYVRIPAPLRAEIDEYAERNGCSISRAAVELLSKALRPAAAAEPEPARLRSDRVEVPAALVKAIGECSSTHVPIVGSYSNYVDLRIQSRGPLVEFIFDVNGQSFWSVTLVAA